MEAMKRMNHFLLRHLMLEEVSFFLGSFHVFHFELLAFDFANVDCLVVLCCAVMILENVSDVDPVAFLNGDDVENLLERFFSNQVFQQFDRHSHFDGFHYVKIERLNLEIDLDRFLHVGRFFLLTDDDENPGTDHDCFLHVYHVGLFFLSKHGDANPETDLDCSLRVYYVYLIFLVMNGDTSPEIDHGHFLHVVHVGPFFLLMNVDRSILFHLNLSFDGHSRPKNVVVVQLNASTVVSGILNGFYRCISCNHVL